jgi:hypothetical protein
MPETHPVGLRAKLVPTDLTYGSGGWKVQEWFAFAHAPGRIVSWDPAAPSGWPPFLHLTDWLPPWPIKFSDLSYLHYLYHPDNISELARKYFNLNTNKNPYIQDNFILTMLTKNGGNPNVDVLFPVVCETQSFSEKTINAVNEPVRLDAGHLDILGRLSDAAHAHPKEDFAKLLHGMTPGGMTPAQEKLFREEARAISERERTK